MLTEENIREPWWGRYGPGSRLLRGLGWEHQRIDDLAGERGEKILFTRGNLGKTKWVFAPSSLYIRESSQPFQFDLAVVTRSGLTKMLERAMRLAEFLSARGLIYENKERGEIQGGGPQEN